MTREILAEEVLLIRDKEVWDSVEVPKQAELCSCVRSAGCGFTIKWLLWQKWISLLVVQQTQSLLVLVFAFTNTWPGSLEFLPYIPDEDVHPWAAARQSKVPAARLLCRTTPVTLALHIPWSLLKPSRWSTGFAVLPCTSHLQAMCSLSPCVVGYLLVSGRKVLALAHQTHRGTRICWGLLS